MAGGTEGWRNAVSSGVTVIPRGAGRSYSDCAYVGDGVTCTSQGLDRVLAFDEAESSVTVGAGLSVSALHCYLSTTSMEFPVFGGTQWATVGGAIAGDIHGKNHAVAGSFGNHVLELNLLTADGASRICSAEERPDLFYATIGGLGLTGFIQSARLRLQPAHNRTVDQTRDVIHDFGQMFDRFETSDDEFSQAVWFDLARPMASGLFCSGRRVESACRDWRPGIRLPLPRVRMVRPNTVRLASAILARAYAHSNNRLVHVTSYNYSGSHELLFHWNKLFGRAGMVEFQFVLSEPAFMSVLDDLVAGARRLSVPLLSAVVKRFGPLPPVGMLSFPLAGYTINVQTVYRNSTVKFVREFTDAVVCAGGRVNLTKDACTTASGFADMYPNMSAWQQIVSRYDPANRIGSNMSRRLSMKPW